MPWKETGPMKERFLFVTDYLKGTESVAELARRYGISRKTAYKWIGRLREHGEQGLYDRSSAPVHCPIGSRRR